MGHYHVDAITSSTVRPSDALRADGSGYILLTGATHAGRPVGESPAVVLINRSAVAMIEITSTGWKAGHGAASAAMLTATTT